RSGMVAAACIIPPPDCTRTVSHAHSALSRKNGAFSHARAKIHDIRGVDAARAANGVTVRRSGQQSRRINRTGSVTNIGLEPMARANSSRDAAYRLRASI